MHKNLPTPLKDKLSQMAYVNYFKTAWWILSQCYDLELYRPYQTGVIDEFKEKIALIEQCGSYHGPKRKPICEISRL